MQTAVVTGGGQDVLVNKAGRQITRQFLDVSESDWDALLGLNLKTEMDGC